MAQSSSIPSIPVNYSYDGGKSKQLKRTSSVQKKQDLQKRLITSYAGASKSKQNSYREPLLQPNHSIENLRYKNKLTSMPSSSNQFQIGYKSTQNKNKQQNISLDISLTKARNSYISNSNFKTVSKAIDQHTDQLKNKNSVQQKLLEAQKNL